MRITPTCVIGQTRKDERKRHICLCLYVQTFELDSANTGVSSHLVSSFAVIFSYIRVFKIKDMKTCVKIF